MLRRFFFQGIADHKMWILLKREIFSRSDFFPRTQNVDFQGRFARSKRLQNMNFLKNISQGTSKPPNLNYLRTFSSGTNIPRSADF